MGLFYVNVDASVSTGMILFTLGWFSVRLYDSLKIG